MTAGATADQSWRARNESFRLVSEYIRPGWPYFQLKLKPALLSPPDQTTWASLACRGRQDEVERDVGPCKHFFGRSAGRRVLGRQAVWPAGLVTVFYSCQPASQ